MNDDLNDESIDLSAWDPELPPAGFADRVMAKVSQESPRKTVSRVRWIATGGVFAMAAAFLLYASTRTPSSGIAKADHDRIEVKLGDRAIAVLEPGAELKWNGPHVEQTKGDVFYRVEKGDGFDVHTAEGDVAVKGTCFRVKLKGDEMATRDWKMGALGALGASALFVGVYEGKVAVSHANESKMVTAGQAAGVSNEHGVVVGDMETGALAAAAGGDNGGDPLLTANRNLVDTVSQYRKRLEAIEGEKKELAERLKGAEKDLDREQRGPDAAPIKNEFDLSQDDLVTLAKEGTLKFSDPCTKKDYRPDADALTRLGLSPQDGDTIAAAYKVANDWREKQMRPICIEAIGRSELTERMPVDGCMHIVSDLLSETNSVERKEAQQMAVDIRAGLRPMPKPGEKVSPLTRMMLSASQVGKVLEDELAKSFGPEEAHRLIYTKDGLCMGQHTWGGRKK